MHIASISSSDPLMQGRPAYWTLLLLTLPVSLNLLTIQKSFWWYVFSWCFLYNICTVHIDVLSKTNILFIWAQHSNSHWPRWPCSFLWPHPGTKSLMLNFVIFLVLSHHSTFDDVSQRSFIYKDNLKCNSELLICNRNVYLMFSLWVDESRLNSILIV